LPKNFALSNFILGKRASTNCYNVFMGMYNIIDIKRNCPNCGAKVEWQSKDLIVDGIYSVVNALKTYILNKRMSGEVHTYCSKCSTWTEAKVVKGKLRKLTVGKSED